MTKRPRERILQKLVYEHYVRPHFDFYQLATAERSLIYSFAEEMTGGEPTADSVALVRRWFDKAWRRAEQEWSQLRDGGPLAFYKSRVSAETPDTSAPTTALFATRVSAETPQPRSTTCHCSRAAAETPPDDGEPEQLELPATHATYAS